MVYEDILSYDSDDMGASGLSILDEDEAPKLKTSEKSLKRKGSDEASTSSSSGQQPKRKKQDLDDTLWRMTRSRFAHTTYRCPKCFYKKIQIIRKKGKVILLQEFCEACAEGNVYMSDVYYRYFGRKNNNTK